MKIIILVLISSIVLSCVPKENKNIILDEIKIENNNDLNIEKGNSIITHLEGENENVEVSYNENIIGIYRFNEFTQFDFNSRTQTNNNNLNSRITFEEHFSKGAIIVGIENRKYYMQYSYPKYSKKYFNINSPIVSGNIIGGTISDYFEYKYNNEVIEFYYKRIYEDEDDEYKNLLLSKGIFNKIDISEYNTYRFSSYNIIKEEGRNINLYNILNAKVMIFKEEGIENYIVYYNIPDENVIVVKNLNGTFIHYLGEHVSSYEHKYYFQDNLLYLHVIIHDYWDDNISHEYYIEFKETQNGT
jgi:hypothetical protein